MVSDILNKLYELQITGICDDSRFVASGDCFVCLKGENYNGRDFARSAILNGAKAILSEEVINTSTVPVIITTNLREKLKEIVIRFYDYPFREMEMIGITGTDGKTTTASITEYLLGLKYKACYIGTNGIRYLNINKKSTYTTPPLCLLNKTLRTIASQNIRYCVMEVSSQGLVDGRCEGLEFDVALFTNLTHEHLDTHKTMDNYFLAKKRLFQKLNEDGLAIVNGDDPYCNLISHPNKVTFGIDNVCDYNALNIRYNQKYTTFDLKTPNGVIESLRVNLHEKYNIYNVLGAIIIAMHYKVPLTLLAQALKSIPKVSGRLELLTTSEPFKVYVDFAHTPNALKCLLESLRKKTKGRLIVVVGAAGGKDKSKRPLMGLEACANSDFVIFTSEDPRFENEIAIIKDLLRDVKTKNYLVVPNRIKAIREAITIASRDDTVVICGKGNDDYYEENGKVYSYSDIQEVIKILNEVKIK